MVWGTSVARTIHPIHVVATLHPEVHPAGPAVDAHHVRALAAAAVHHHDGQWTRLLFGQHVLHEHLAHRDGAVGHLLALHADPEVALAAQSEAGGLDVTRRVDAGSNGPRDARFGNGAHPLEDGFQSVAIVL